MSTEKKVSLFLDSGAYSAMTQGAVIDIYEYIEFIKKHKDIIEIYANLDVIAEGTNQPNRTTAEKTLANQQIMEDAGLSPLPVFHAGEPMEYLEEYVKKYEYIGLGGLVGTSVAKSFPVLDRCFCDVICDDKGYPKVKVHGFGITSLKSLIRYPWYSVDSTSWVVAGRVGGVLIPQYRNGKWEYNDTNWKISVSNRSPDKKEAGMHIDNISPKQREVLMRYITEKGYILGKSEFHKESQKYELKEQERWAEKKPKSKAANRLVETIIEPGLSNTYQLRDELNIIYFLDLEKSLPEWPWSFRLGGVKGFLL